MKRILIAAVVALTTIAFSSCKSKTIQSTVPYQANTPIECVSEDPAGAQLLRVWGKGMNVDEAVENARKSAVEAVLFSYITRGTGNFKSIPIIDNRTIRGAHSQYFNKFFKNGGEYKKFAKKQKVNKDNVLEGGNLVVVETLLLVDRPALKAKMKKDNIIE